MLVPPTTRSRVSPEVCGGILIVLYIITGRLAVLEAWSSSSGVPTRARRCRTEVRAHCWQKQCGHPLSGCEGVWMVGYELWDSPEDL